VTEILPKTLIPTSLVETAMVAGDNFLEYESRKFWLEDIAPDLILSEFRGNRIPINRISIGVSFSFTRNFIIQFSKPIKGKNEQQ
jgi:hypothetical protein